MDSQTLSKQQEKEKTEQVKLSENLEQKKNSLDEEQQKKEDVKESELKKNLLPSQEMSSKVVLTLKESLEKKDAKLQPVPVDVINLHEEMSDKEINALSLAQMRTLIDKIAESPELKHEKDLKKLLSVFSYVLTLDGEQSKYDRSVLKTELDVHLKHIQGNGIIINTEKESPIFANLAKLIKNCYKEDKLEFSGNLEVAHANGDAAFKALNAECNGVFEQIDKNPMYDTEDRLVRKIELYNSYRSSALEAARQYQSRSTVLHKVNFEYKLHLMEKQLADYREQKKIVSEEIKRTEKEMKELKEGTIEVSLKKKKLNELKELYRKHYSSSFATDVKELDQFEEVEKNRAADNTLDLLQIERVRQIDRWLIQNATDDYKDKGFMAEVMGCTVRERLTMYLCLERDNKKMDQAKLIFSQTNYLPDFETIKSNMTGWKIFRKMGFKGISWGKMHQAFEYVTGKREDLKKIADIAYNAQNAERYKENKQNEFTLTSDETGRKYLIDNEDVDKKYGRGLQEDELHRRALDLGEQILIDIQLLRNKKPENAQEITTRYNTSLKELRAVVNRESELAKSAHHKKFWDRYKTTLKYMTLADYVPLAGSVVGSVSRSMEWIDENHGLTKFTDGMSYGGLYYSGVVQLATMIKTSADMFGHWKESSKTANAQRILATGKTIAPIAESVATIGYVTRDFGVWAEGYGKYRREMADRLAKRVENGQGAYKFDLAKTGTYCQLVGSALTVGSSAIDYYNINRSRKACKSIREQIRGKFKDTERGINKEYREVAYKKSLARLMDGINVRKGITATTNIVNNAAGYMKFIIPNAYIGIITTVTTTAISVITGGIASYLKKKHDTKAMDAFLDTDQMVKEYKNRFPGRVVDEEFTRKQMRKYAMLKLGFANTKTFFVHMAEKLATMIKSTLASAQEHEEERETAQPLVTILKSVGLRVDFTKKIIPDAKLIAKKLSE